MIGSLTLTRMKTPHMVGQEEATEEKCKAERLMTCSSSSSKNLRSLD